MAFLRPAYSYPGRLGGLRLAAPHRPTRRTVVRTAWTARGRAEVRG
jgi:hypothetical protein